MQDISKFRIPMFSDKGTFLEYQYLQLGDDIYVTLCGQNGEPEQCTGLKDKNGKLVYFNDLIRLDDGLIGIVKQVEDVKSTDYGRIIVHLTCSLNKKYPTYYIPTVVAESEVIGNIYTNKELLESEV